MQPIPASIESFRKDIKTAPWGFFGFDVSHSGSGACELLEGVNPSCFGASRRARNC